MPNITNVHRIDHLSAECFAILVVNIVIPNKNMPKTAQTVVIIHKSFLIKNSVGPVNPVLGIHQ